jgi:hypothetical protein
MVRVMRRWNGLGFVLVFLVVFGCAKNRCRERVDELRAMALVLMEQKYQREPLAFVEVVELGKGAEVPLRAAAGTKPPTFIVRGRADERFEAAAAMDALRTLRAKGTVRMCAITPDLKLERSATADPKERERALALVKDALPEDRATVLAGALGESDVCEVKRCIDSAAVDPAEKEQFMATCFAEELEACGFPRSGSERVFALVTVMLDTWDYATDCVGVDLTSEATAPAVVLEPSGTFGKLLASLRPHDGKSARLETAKP